jgi:predicted amidohydrolase
MVKQDLNIAAIQAPLYWENPEKNFHLFDEKIVTIPKTTDLIILPEMFSTGFSMNTDLITEESSAKALKWMKYTSAKQNAALCGSLAIKEGELFYNRLYWVNPDGSFNHYDKRHLFSLSKEHESFTKGKSRLIVEFKGWKICPLICYDLRFPVWSRNALQNETSEFDLLLYVANWPEKRVFAWQNLLIARAIENQSYAVGVNRIGNDANEVPYSGDSMIIDPLGVVLQHAENEERILLAKLSFDYLNKIRTNLPFLNDADNYEIKN